MLVANLQRVCELQKAYSSENTLPMQERGVLIRSALAQDLRDELSSLAPAFGDLANELSVEGSDGIGRKTEAPWVRIYCHSMSPSAREGFYIVIHFAADGSAVFLTVGCGSTVWTGGDLKAISDEELTRRTAWARSVVIDKWQSLEPFIDKIELGAKAPLPKTFEKATALARRFPVSSITIEDFRSAFIMAGERLAEIYRSQRSGRDITPADQEASEITAVLRPLRASGRRQGFNLTGPERKAVELRAMDVAKEWLEGLGFAWKDQSASDSFDLLASKNGASHKVEVKGTTSDICDAIVMTKNEVDLHRREKGATALAIVSSIRLDRSVEPVHASGGSIEMLWEWDIDEWGSDAIAFQVKRPTKK